MKRTACSLLDTGLNRRLSVYFFKVESGAQQSFLLPMQGIPITAGVICFDVTGNSGAIGSENLNCTVVEHNFILTSVVVKCKVIVDSHCLNIP